jgi:sugar phosphate permease
LLTLPQTQAGWRWIYILEGIITVVTGIAVFFVLPDSPERARWLTPREKQFVYYRLEQDSGTKEGKVHTSEEFSGKSALGSGNFDVPTRD